MGTENSENISMTLAFAQMQDSIKQLGKRLAEATFSTMAFA